MEIGNFSPLSGRSNGLCLLMAPVKALIALFLPPPAALAHACPVVGRSPTRRTSMSSGQTSVAHGITPTLQSKQLQMPRLKVLREFEPGASRSCAGRLVISGRMSDVCEELERLAR